MELTNNSNVNWTESEYYYDENGQAHAKHLEYGDDYTLEDGNLIDDVDAILRGIIIRELEDENAPS